MFIEIDAKVRQQLDNAQLVVSGAELHMRLGLLAFHMELDKRPDREPEEITVRVLCTRQQAISWLFDGPLRNYQTPLQLTEEQQAAGVLLLDAAEQLGWITQSVIHTVRFSSLDLQRYFCAAHLFTQPFDSILTRAVSPYFPWLRIFWLEHDPDLIDKLIEAAFAPSEWHRQEYAIQVLEGLGDKRAVEPLIRLLSQTDFSRRVRSRAATALAKLGDSRAIEPLIESFGIYDLGYDFGPNMQSLGEAAFSALVTALYHEDPLVRKRASISLGRFKDPRAVNPLIEVLKDSDQHVRQITIFNLGLLGDRRAVEPILSVLNTPADVVNWYTLQTIKRLEAKAAVPKLIEALKVTISRGDDVQEVTDSVVHVLEKLDVHGKVLKFMLADPESAQFIQAANYVVDDRVIPHLARQIEAAAQSDEYEKAEAILYALGSLGSQEAVPLLLQRLDTYPKPAIRSLADLGYNQTFDICLPYLKHPNKWVRSESISVLMKLLDEKAVAPLIQVFEDDYDDWIRSFAISALSRFSSPLVPPMLHVALQDSDGGVRVAAIRAVNKLRDLTNLPMVKLMQQLDTERTPIGDALWVVAELAVRDLQSDASHIK